MASNSTSVRLVGDSDRASLAVVAGDATIVPESGLPLSIDVGRGLLRCLRWVLRPRRSLWLSALPLWEEELLEPPECRPGGVRRFITLGVDCLDGERGDFLRDNFAFGFI